MWVGFYKLEWRTPLRSHEKRRSIYLSFEKCGILCLYGKNPIPKGRTVCYSSASCFVPKNVPEMRLIRLKINRCNKNFVSTDFIKNYGGSVNIKECNTLTTRPYKRSTKTSFSLAIKTRIKLWGHNHINVWAIARLHYKAPLITSWQKWCPDVIEDVRRPFSYRTGIILEMCRLLRRPGVADTLLSSRVLRQKLKWSSRKYEYGGLYSNGRNRHWLFWKLHIPEAVQARIKFFRFASARFSTPQLLLQSLPSRDTRVLE